MEKVIKNLREKLNNEKVLVACSTGVDSMVLLHLVIQALPTTQIVVAHVNHQKRAKSEIEEYRHNYESYRQQQGQPRRPLLRRNGHFCLSL